jgi:O-antigen/teichoic acid export membrane protein
MIVDSLKVLAGTVVSNLLTVVRTFIIIRNLNPETYGVWNLFTVFLSYTIWFELGVLSGTDKLIPFLRGQSNLAEVVRMRNVSFTTMIILYLFLAAVIFVVSGTPAGLFPPEISPSVRLLAIVAFLAAMQNYFLTLSRAEKKFGTISMTNGLFTLSVVILLPVLYLHMQDKLFATLLSFILAYSLSVLFCIRSSGLTFRLDLDVPTLKRMIQAGYPLVFIGIGFVIFMSVDRWMIASYLTKWDLGLYAFGYTIGIMLYSLVAVVAYVLYPRMLEKIGEGHSGAYFRPHVYRALVIMSSMVAVSGCMVMISLPLLCHLFFPLYSDALNLTGILMAGFFFLSIATISGNFLVAADRQNTILRLQVLLIVCGFFAYLFAIKTTGDVHGVAVVTACTLSLYGFFILYFSFRHMECTFRESCRILLTLSVPLLGGAIVWYALKTANDRFSAQYELIVILPEIVMVFLLFLGLFVIQNRKTGVLEEIRPLLAAIGFRYKGRLFF